MHTRNVVRAVGLGLLLWTAAAAAGERGFFGYGLQVTGKGFFLNPTIKVISIASVVPGSPAARGRIAVGDSIVKVEGVAIEGRKANELKAMAQRDVGETLHLELKRRNGQVYSVALVAVPAPRLNRAFAAFWSLPPPGRDSAAPGWDNGAPARPFFAVIARAPPSAPRRPIDAMTTPSRRDLANAIRFLAVDAVQAANSGHPGMPMGMADIAEVLWNDYLNHNPANPKWFNRDRFILSNGHGSMLQYALLHLAGYDLSIEDLRNFRQLESKTPGHPENFMTPGVETTTGPLGQGFANAVGMALAEKLLAQRFNQPEMEIVDHRTWVFMGDGCLMEGISHEAASLAGTWGLHKLVAFWDDNKISIDGNTDGWFTDNTPARFEAYGWNVVRGVDGHDSDAIKRAIDTAMLCNDKPTLICCRTMIGYGSPGKAGKESSHGAPLGPDEIIATRGALNWEHEEFHIAPAIYDGWRVGNVGLVREAEWNRLFDQYAARHPQLADELTRRSHAELPEGFAAAADAYIAKLQADGPVVASRKASQMAIEAFAPLLPELVGGSADLAHSNLTLWSRSKSVATDDPNANYIYFGVREFGMTAISNGLSLHGGFIPYDATFLVFSDYARNAVRMSALMGAHAIHVYTHDSIGLGEDGPTHQPIEHLASLRYIPQNDVWRPCDAVESAVSWRAAIERADGPSCLVFSRQNLAHQPRSNQQVADIARGGYVLRDGGANPDVILIATGSEVGLATKAADALAGEGKQVRVVSMPSTDVFDRQDAAYRESVLPNACRKRVAIEAGVSDFWRKYVGLDGAVIGIDTFGASAPIEALMPHFGFTVERVVAAAKAL